MANELRMNSTVSVLQDVVEGEYSILQHDINANQRRWGGRYSLPAYESSRVCYWKNVIIEDTSAVTIGGSAPFVGTPSADDGNVPGMVLGVSVEYISEVGSPGVIKITIGTQVHARLSVGEGIFIPISGSNGGGIGISNVKLSIAEAYVEGTTEAHVNVMLVGFAGAE